MGGLATTAIFAAVLASYLLVLLAVRKAQPRTLPEFLFAGNRTGLAVASGVGSLFSMSVACTALLSAGYLYGWQILLSSIAGTSAGTLLLLRLATLTQTAANDQAAVNFRERGAKSYLRLLEDNTRPQYPVSLALVLLFVYIVILGSELAVLRVVSASLTAFEYPELLAVLVMVVAICFSYIYIGGYRGVLLTDHLQVIVIAGFFGMLVGHVNWHGFDWHLVVSQSALPMSTLHQLALHAACFVGSACAVLGNLDHWYRTVGTLTKKQAKVAIIASSTLGSIAGSVLVLAGISYAHARLRLPLDDLAGQTSLRVLTAIIDLNSKSLTFMFFAAMTCIALTTIDTYLITQQQLYNEFASRFAAKTGRGYLVEYFLQWPRVRGIGLLLLGIALVLSMLIPDDQIYSVGVAALSAPIPFSCLLAYASFKPQHFARKPFAGRFATASIVLGFGLWGPIALALGAVMGPLQLRLYLIPLSLILATSLSTSICLIPQRTKIGPKGEK